MRTPTLYAFRFDGSGGVHGLGWRDAVDPDAAAGEGWLWLHLDRSEAEARAWLRSGAGLPPEAVAALTDDDTHPRATRLGDGVLLILRGPSRNDASATAGLSSIRLFIEPHRVISVRLRPLAASAALAESFVAGAGPRTPGELLVDLADRILDDLERRLDGLIESIDQLEELALAAPTGELRTRRLELNRLRSAAVQFRRHLGPQAAALSRASSWDASCLDQAARPGLMEASDQTTRIAADLDELRERAALVGEEMQARMTDRMNRTMVTLAVVSTVFLPLTFLTGLFGANLAGIPFAERPWSFAAFAGGLAAVAAATAYAVRRINRP